MAIYVFSLLVGYAPNGVDYAQGYRARILRKLPYPVRYIFAEIPGGIAGVLAQFWIEG